jgi:hypothetical protein
MSILKHLVALSTFILITVTVSAQRKVINGFLRDSATLFPIADGILTNSTVNKAVRSDKNGFFRLEAGANDFIYASAKSYRFDTLKYSLMFTDTITIFLPFAGTVLPEVTVKGKYSKYQRDSIDRRKEFEESRGTVLKTLATNHPSGFGLTFNLDKAFKKKYKNQDRDEKLFTTLEKMAYINYRFSPNLVAYYTGFKGDKLKTFMNLYTPSFQWLRQHSSNEDVLYYINDKLKLYKATAGK